MSILEKRVISQNQQTVDFNFCKYFRQPFSCIIYFCTVILIVNRLIFIDLLASNVLIFFTHLLTLSLVGVLLHALFLDYFHRMLRILCMLMISFCKWGNMGFIGETTGVIRR